MRKSITVNTIFNVLYKVLNMLFPLITSIYLARVLGPVYIGKVSYAQSILSYFTVIASLGIPTYGMREISKHRNDIDARNKVFSELFLLNFISTIVCSAIYTLIIILFSKSSYDYKLFISVGLTLYLNVFNIDWFYSGLEEYVYITVRSLIVKVFSIFAILLAVNSQEDYILYALILSVATTGNYIWNIINVKKRVKLQFKNLEFRRHMKPVLILLMTMLATDLYNQIDITMLGVFRTDAEVGYYSNGIRLIRMVNSITTAISATILPRMCLYFKENKKEKFQTLFWKNLDIVLLLSLPCAVGLMLVAKPLVEVLFGVDFLPAAPIIQCLSPIIVIISVSYLFGSVVLTSTNNERYLLRATISGSVVNIILNAALITNFGTIGAVFASVLGETVVFAIHIKYGKKYIIRETNLKYVKSIMISLIGMTIVVLEIQRVILKPSVALVGSVIGGAVVYFIILITLKNPIVAVLIDNIRFKLKRKQK